MHMTTLLMLAVLTLAAGCGERRTAPQTGGKVVGKSVTDFASGIGKGLDSSLLVNVSTAPEMEPQGLSITTAKWTTVQGYQGDFDLCDLQERVQRERPSVKRTRKSAAPGQGGRFQHR